MQFDIPTAMQLTATMTLFIGVALAFCVQGYPSALQQPIRLWVRGLLLQSGAYILLAFRGMAPDLLTVVLANGLLARGLMLQMQALRELNQRPQRGAHFAALLLVLLVAEVLLTYVWPDPARRVMLSSLILAIVAGYGVVAIHHKRGRLTRAERMLVGTLALGMLILLVRVALPKETGLDSMQQSSMLAGVVFTYGALLPVIATTGFVLMLGERLNEDLARLATIDPLTGAYNRRTLSALADHALASARRQQQPLAVLLLDVDHFKSINDEFGHEAGDAALCTLVRLLLTQLRGQDVVSRIGGEEFAIMLPECTEEAAVQMAERLRQRVEEVDMSLSGWPIRLRVSIGVSALGPNTPDLASLLREADRALYVAKRGGRNQVVPASQIDSTLARDVSG